MSIQLPKSLQLKGFTESDIKVRYVKLDPQGQQSASASGNNIIIYRPGREGLIVGDELRHSYLLDLDGDAGNSEDLDAGGAASIWRRVRIKIGNMEVQDTREYAQMYSNMRMATHGTDRLIQEAVLDGSLASGTTEVAIDGTATRFAIAPLKKSFLDQPMIPAFNMPQVEIRYEMETNVAKYSTGSAAVATADVTSPYLWYPVIYSAKLQEFFKSNNYTTHFSEFDHHQFSHGSGATSLRDVIPSSHKSIAAIWSSYKETADVTDADQGLKYYQRQVFPSITRLEVLADGNTQIMDRPAENVQDLYQLMLRGAGHYGNKTSPALLTRALYSLTADGRYIEVLPLNAHDEHVAGLNTAHTSGNIVVSGTYTAPAALTVDRHLELQKRIVFGSNGVISVSA